MVEQELRKLGRTVYRRSGASGLDTLTARELEIARLVVDRQTNTQIAATLFLSKKTVETHLRNIFAKVGVSSRVELARAVERADRSSGLTHASAATIAAIRPPSSRRGIPTVAAMSRSRVPARRIAKIARSVPPSRSAARRCSRGVIVGRPRSPRIAASSSGVPLALSTIAAAPAKAAGTIASKPSAGRVEHDTRPRVPRPHRKTELELVDEHDIGVGAVQQRPQLVPVGGGADRHDARRLAEDRLQAGPHRGVGVEDRDADHARAPGRDGARGGRYVTAA